MSSKKKWLTLGLVCVVVAAFGTFIFFQQRSAVHFLPQMGEKQKFIVVGIENPKLWARRGRQLISWYQAKGVSLPSRTKEVLSLVEARSNDVSSAAALVYQDDAKRWRWVVSLTPSKEAIASLKEGTSSSLPISGDLAEWDSQGRGKKGWMFTSPLTGEKAYVLLHSIFPKPLILAASDIDELDRAIAAIRSSSDRLQWKNENAAPDYALLRIPVKKDQELATVNLGWIEDAKSAHLQITSDYLKKRSSTQIPSTLGLGDVPLLGNGELVLVAGADIPFLAQIALPDATDPIAESLQFAQMLTRVDQSQLALAEKLLRSSRISAVVTLPPGSEDRLMRHGAAYVVIESKEKDELQKMAQVFGAMFTPVTLDGWTWMYKRESPNVPTVVMGAKDAVLLLGFAQPESLQAKATIPAQLANLAAPKDYLSLIVSTRNASSREFLLSLLRSLYPSSSQGAAFVSDLEGSMHLRLKTPEKADIGFFWED